MVQVDTFGKMCIRDRESGVEGAAFELYAKDTIYSPDGAKDEQGNPVIR